MKYMGSKSRIAKEILPIILKERKPKQWYVEPFVGGGNMINNVPGPRMGSDSDRFTIEALLSIRDHVDELPKNNSEFTEIDYKALKLHDDYAHKGYAGFSLSYAGIWLSGWRRDREGKRDYVNESYRNALKQSLMLQGCVLFVSSYDDFFIPQGSLIYCDPPYADTAKYKDSFNHEAFWGWCRVKASEGHVVFVSEYHAPEDFKCIWEKRITSSLAKNTGSKTGLEKLFTIQL